MDDSPQNVMPLWKHFVYQAVAFCLLLCPFLAPLVWPKLDNSFLLVFYALIPLLTGLIAFALGTWGIVGWLFTRNARYYSRMIVPVAAFAAVVCCTAVQEFVTGGLPAGSNWMKFDSATWLSNESHSPSADGPTARQMMLCDIVRNVLPGRTRAEIESFLGPGREPDRFNGDYGLIYCTGPQRDSLFPVDSELLEIWLAPDGKFDHFELSSD